MSLDKKRQQVKEFLFDDLLEFLEETGETNSVTPDEIAALVDEPLELVKQCMEEMQADGVVLIEADQDGVWQVRLTDETLARLLEEMRAAGWIPPVNEGDDEDQDWSLNHID